MDDYSDEQAEREVERKCEEPSLTEAQATIIFNQKKEIADLKYKLKLLQDMTEKMCTACWKYVVPDELADLQALIHKTRDDSRFLATTVDFESEDL